MGIKADIQSDLADAFDDDLLDAVKTITLIKGNSTYDPSTGNNTLTGDIYSGRGIAYNSEIREIFNESFNPGDIVVIILQNELNSSPEIDDFLNISGYTYKIIDVMEDPVSATWEVLCRK